MGLIEALEEQFSEAKDAVRLTASQIVEPLRQLKLSKAAEIVESGVEETLVYMDFPLEHWQRSKTNNPLEGIMHEMGSFSLAGPTAP